MDNSTQLPASIHGYDMFFENISQKDLEKIAIAHRGVSSTKPKLKKVTCKFSRPVVVNDVSEIFSILFSVCTSGELIAKDYDATYSGGELYITGVGMKSSSLEELFP